MKKVLVINGPNLNLLGIREKNIYGSVSYEDVLKSISRKAQELGFEVEFFQSNHEGEIIDKIHRAYFEKVDAIIINPGAYTHYSYAIHDAIKAVNIPTIEVHISNIHAREEFRHKSVIAPACTGQISGFGIKSYIIALYALKEILD
ncbi:3-dehydroquinate dehydratase [Caldicellulosiruptor bescii]|jgi:3-dehydroquinate dehydratase-2|uniref:3-dehydroquinate dehydratase n=2 Tax=Caldicellulosiruptor bescii TaxID=31899 RepID=AROQ_CALBD|nr:type II 3-dehydroquinate dehydratase [Caldicellulosiruptor bescii]B9MKD4.1 RecName: Full=3-dehydroquinate dehydratase; Short=3-dehydroquinase; AltName: Full=Type II DHQase [Caldicellulosiruptor bescii DSM 6725]ACM60792.1 3-dehydroquinate dehydratase, type II [Caldicellulosiruptor bescii DSM 6725]PBC89392.1 3-dehydroquinate dehydratase [Caldicellulosiruptor bescii]PBC91123.1 3-dehydroquinate dehydratase [Caldicellulosiruptor bescii]PBD03463.1 3-dehydroquinate dehydratase [Caldicellulosirupto